MDIFQQWLIVYYTWKHQRGHISMSATGVFSQLQHHLPPWGVSAPSPLPTPAPAQVKAPGADYGETGRVQILI